VYFVYFVVDPLSERGTGEGAIFCKALKRHVAVTPRKRVLAGPDLAGYGMGVFSVDECAMTGDKRRSRKQFG